MIKRGVDIVENGVDGKLLASCVSEFLTGLGRMNRLYDYYLGRHDILSRARRDPGTPNNRIVNNYAKYITDTAVGYMFSNPAVYSAGGEAVFPELSEAFRRADVDTHDAELGKYLSVFGTASELIYMDKSGGATHPAIAVIDPREAFVVYDDTVACSPLFGVHLRRASGVGGAGGCAIDVYTESDIQNFKAPNLGCEPERVGAGPHFFGGVPLIEYWNNEEGQGDFEHVVSLIDAYNVLQSDRVNDKQRFVDALLVIRNAELDEKTGGSVLENGLLQLPADSDAFYVTKTLNESEIDILRNSLSSDIHKFSQTPDFTDERFSGNASGVALRFKLLSLEYLAKVKERFFVEGLRERLKIFANILNLQGKPQIDASSVNITFNRALPINEFENAQTLAMYKNAGLASTETLMSQISFVKDIGAEAAKIEETRAAKAAVYDGGEL
jgi:SPP1 family phage portal protein